MSPLTKTIHARLEASRKDLLDLGLRNPLLNYKASKARGLQIVQEKSTAIFDIIVRQNKAMTFLGRPSKGEAPDELELPPLTEQEQEDAYQDTKLQTNEVEKQLQLKILNTYYFAKTSIEEQGVNILYLALGMLSWYEEDNKEDKRLAPLILVPVSLERSSAQERFRLRYTGGEIGANLSLQAKMLAEFSITIPDLEDLEELNIVDYFSDIQKRIEHHSSWGVDGDTIELGFFSFGKFMIYHDLDSDKWPLYKKPFENEMIISLLGEGFKEPVPTFTEEHHLDTQTNADQLFQVVDADSSQILAMLAAHEGRNLVIQGPPGTGKSQTITNLIANAVGQGKKVLFVAEKLAALEVVKRRLDNIHLGEACLELHSHKANKKAVHEELKRILELGKPTLTHLEQEITLLDSYRTSLNDYCAVINADIQYSGLNTQKVIGFLLELKEICADVEMRKIYIADLGQWNVEKMHRAEAMADRIEAILQQIGTPSKMIFWGCKLKNILPHEKEMVDQLLLKLKDQLQLLQTENAAAAQEIGLTIPLRLYEIRELIQVAKLAASRPALKGIQINDERWLLQFEDIKELLKIGERLSEIHAKYDDQLIPEAWQQNMQQIRQDIQAHGHKWYKFLIGSYNRSSKELSRICRGRIADDITTKLQLVDAITEAARLEKNLAEYEQLAISLFGGHWKKIRSDWSYLRQVLQFLAEVHANISEQRCPNALLTYLQRQVDIGIAASIAVNLEKQRDTYLEQLKLLLSTLAMDEVIAFGEKGLMHAPFDIQFHKITNWQLRLSEIHAATQWNNLTDNTTAEGFGFLLKPVIDWPEAQHFLKIALKKAWYEHLIEQAMSHSVLRSFERAGHEDAINKFRNLDQVKLQYNRARVALKHWQGVPRQDAGGQVSILKNEFNRKARHKPMRRLIQDAGLAIQAIKPVFMMSPMSIANFLAPGSIEFDLVVFDEASQVRPVDAMGAMLRAKQLIVVGDTRQLPPTIFFDKANNETEDEDNITADMQSILGMCNGQGLPERMLRWHYRSRHESLISLSNHEFYENKLVIFPSAGDRHQLGLIYHHLPDTIYDSGKTRTNPKEAEAVADAVMEHAAKHPKQTLGVIAFSTSQMQAIQLALEIRRRKKPELESYFRSHANEPFVVKNLENVQGDERDVIFISLGYGRTEDGKVPQRFGPLNNNGGERRLNVLITRAKYRCEVFTNMTSEDIQVTQQSKLGVRTLKSFLYFAQHGKFDTEEDIPIPVQTPFEDYLTAKLKERGYTVRQKVGMEGVYIDLAVIDDIHPDRYLLGIDCDGNSYNKAKSARDRDRLRPQVLELIGWRMYQAWSLDWLYHSEKELERLIQTIEKIKDQVRRGDEEAEAYEAEIAVLMREKPVEPINVICPYSYAELPSEIATQEFHLHPVGKITVWLQEVVRVEGPVHFDEAAFRLTRAAGISKIGSRIRESLEQAAKHAEQLGNIKIKNDFLWHKDLPSPVIRDRSNLPTGSKKIQYIATEELALGVKKVVDDSIAIQPDAAMPFIAKLFGFSRLTDEMKKELSRGIEHALASGAIKQEGELLRSMV